MSIRIPMARSVAARAAERAPWLAACLALASCGGGGDDPASRPVALSFDFAGGIAGWSGAAADYTAETAPIDVVWAHAALPAPLAGSGFRLSGTNHSDDLFIYVKRQVGGLQHGRSYGVAMQLRLATGAPSGCVGVGGAPGESVWVHAGATASEPRTVLQGAQDYRVNIDRGNQSVGGQPGRRDGDDRQRQHRLPAAPVRDQAAVEPRPARRDGRRRGARLAARRHRLGLRGLQRGLPAVAAGGVHAALTRRARAWAR